jgi:hypothetical protein
MLEQAQRRALPLLNRAPDLTPAAQACCGVCRSCMTTNVVTVAGAALAAVTVYFAGLARRAIGRRGELSSES